MPDPAPNAELMRSLGRLVRGLSAVFWGLPVTLVVCVWTANPQWLRSFGIVPPMACTGLLVYGLAQLGAFQKQERIWRNALDRARVLSLINFFLSPFLYWWSRMPSNLFFLSMVLTMALSALLFLACLNLVLRRLGAMLPDEALRLETRQFTLLNLNLLLLTFLLALLYGGLVHLQKIPLWLVAVAGMLERGSLWFLIVLVLLPLAMTMAMLWKTKEVILDNVFAAKG
jgi:hypothetical protein